MADGFVAGVFMCMFLMPMVMIVPMTMFMVMMMVVVVRMLFGLVFRFAPLSVFLDLDEGLSAGKMAIGGGM